MTTEEETKDESFEIISEKEKHWRDTLVKAETDFIRSESNLAISKLMIKLAKAEVAKEAEKNAS